MKLHRGSKALLAVAAVLALTGATATGAVAQQAGTIVGTVTDARTGEPLSGVQVHLPAAALGTLTGADGRFRVAGVPAGEHEVRVQRIGFTTGRQTVTMAEGATVTLDFALRTAVVDLEEIVVTGVAAATPRTKLPFEVARVNAADIIAPGINPASALQGRVAGAQVVQGSGLPGATGSILLRGPTSINAAGRSQDPLFIVDGVILGASLVDIEALDIENIEVVKGAAAASLYGSRAAHGVVQITTRTGRGLASDAQRWTFRTELGQNFMPNEVYPVPQNHVYQMTPDGQYFIDGEGVAFDWIQQTDRWHREYYATGGSPTVRMPTQTGGTWDTFQDQEWPNRPGYELVDPARRFLNPGGTQNLYLAAEGRSGRTNYHASFGRLQQQGLFQQLSGLTRNSFRINLDQGVADNIQVSARAFYSNSRNDGQDLEGSGSPFFTVTRMRPIIDLTRTVDGELQIRPDYTRENDNPLYVVENQERFDDRSRFLGGANLRWTPLTFLDLDANLSYDRSDVNREQFNFRGYRTARPGSVQTGYLYRDGWRNEALNTSLTGTFRASLGAVNTRTQLRYLYEAQDYEFNRGSGLGQTIEGVRALRAFPDTRRTDSRTQAVRSEGYFGITNLDILDRYILDVLVRRDGSSLFGPDERWQTYYRAAAAWRMGAEPWFHVDAINELKLRYSIGTAGSRPTFVAQYETFSVDLATGNPTAGITLGNPALRPEFSVEHEAGVEVGAFGALLALTYAFTETSDQILSAPLPALTGFQTQWVNAGTLESRTFEATLDFPVVQTRNINWTGRVLFDRTRQEITELNIPAYQTGPTGVQVQGGPQMFWIREGESLGTIYGLRWATGCGDLPADLQGQCAAQFDVNDDGYLVWVGEGNNWRSMQWGVAGPSIRGTTYHFGQPITAQDEEGETFLPIGNTQPDFTIGLSSNFNWRGLQIAGLIDATQGFSVYNYPRHWAYFENAHRDQDQAQKPVEERKPVGYYGSSGLYNVLGPPNSHFIEDGSFVKLREFALSYRFGDELLGNVFRGIPALAALDGVTLSMIGRNLLTLTNYSGFDPEVGLSGGGLGSAALTRVDGFSYPNFRTLTFGVELNF
jgi:TonB-linked SusC/RagA family outer membrane protein